MRFDVGVVGGGSGGFAAAFCAALHGVSTVLVERDMFLGGSSTNAGVNCWEPVAGADGLPRLLYERMRRIPEGCAIYSTSRHISHMVGEAARYPGAEQRIAPCLGYSDTLKKGWNHSRLWTPGLWNGVIFESSAWHHCAMGMLSRTGCCRVLLGRRAVSVETAGRGISSVTLDDGARLEAGVWIDNSGFLALAAGCDVLRGEDPRGLFGEPGAPEAASPGRLNGVTLIFRVAPAMDEKVEALSRGISSSCWWADAFPLMVATEYPNGDLNCNMLPTMAGPEFSELGEDAAMAECGRRVLAYWRHLQSEWPEFRRYRMRHVFKRLGIRESFRVSCRYMLNERDLTGGLAAQTHPDIIATADHAIDRHGAGGLARPVLEYGVPYRSLLPARCDNLLLAGRICGFSSMAASSCRLSRTMMRLGEAAGHAAAMAVRDRRAPADIDIEELKSMRCERLMAEKTRKGKT